MKDHRELGRELELFFTDDIAPGAPFWLPNGMIIFKELERYIRKLTGDAGYLETSTPIMVKSELFKQSGHWEKFGEHNMYNLPIYEEEEEKFFLENIDLAEKEGQVRVLKPKGGSPTIFPVANFSLKPMNCPESTILYRFKTRSYKDLPLRLSEIGRLHRREKSGEVNGLLRVRQITMDDAHIYAREDQIFEETSKILDMMIEFYKSFNFEYEFRLATKPEKRAGTDKNWIKAEKDLAEVLNKKNIKAGNKKGDGAFYGPKIDMHIKDSQSREWQLATVQLDFHQPEAFKLEYIDEKGESQRPVMIHRAIFGSFERFIAILTEHFQGAFPVWLSPTQAIVLPISDKFISYAKKVQTALREKNIRVEIDQRNETLQAKIRDAALQKIPYLLIVGTKEQEARKVAVRTRESKDLGPIDLDEFTDKIIKEVENKA